MLVEGSGVLHVQTSSSVLPCAQGCVCTHIKEDRKNHLEGDDIMSRKAFSCMCKAWSSVAR